MEEMKKDKDPVPAIGSLSLYDLGYEVVEKISQNDELMDLIRAYDGDIAGEIEMFIDLSDLDNGWIVTNEEEARKEWTVTLPLAIMEDVKKFVAGLELKEPEGSPYEM